MFVKSLNLFFQQKNCIKTIAKMKKKFLNTTVNFQRKNSSKQKLSNILNFLISIMASVAGYYICKWLDRDE